MAGRGGGGGEYGGLGGDGDGGAIGGWELNGVEEEDGMVSEVEDGACEGVPLIGGKMSGSGDRGWDGWSFLLLRWGDGR